MEVVLLVVLYGLPLVLFVGACVYQSIENARWWRDR